TELPRLGIFRRTVAGLGRSIVGEFDHHAARPAVPFGNLALAAARNVARAELLENWLDGDGVWLVAVHALHIDERDPVALRHVVPLFTFLSPARSLRRLRPPRPSGREHRRPA